MIGTWLGPQQRSYVGVDPKRLVLVWRSRVKGYGGTSLPLHGGLYWES